jgi:hypothetical protein
MMKAPLVIAIILSVSGNLFASDLIGWRVSEFKESSYKFKLTRSAFSKAPIWKPEEQSPPLSPRKAFAIALAQAKELRPEVTNWNNPDIRLTPVGANDERGQFKGEWIYMVRLQDCSEPIFGVPFQLDIPVYLDGSTVEPAIEKRKRYKAEQGAAANP